MVKGIDNAFDYMELCLVLQAVKYFLREIGFYFPEIILTTEFPGSNFLLPTLSIGSKWDFQVADLLLATANFEPWDYKTSKYSDT